MAIYHYKCTKCKFDGRSAFSKEYALEEWNKARECGKCGKPGIFNTPEVSPCCNNCGDGHDPDKHGYG